MLIKCVPLGAGQDVGKSCVIVTVGGKNIMFDCGMHMGYQDERRYPDFSYISKIGDFTHAIDCIIVTHFHLDHIGALPYFTEVCGYDGPIYMTYPTKALAPLMLEDYRKVMVERKGEQEQFSVLQIQKCMKKVTAVDLRQTIKVSADLEIRAYYAGHVLGAAMFWVKVGDDTIVYTGDYNMTPDRHLGAAQIDRLEPDLLITESTYATTVRDSKRVRERDFLKAVHNCVAAGGKVLIPVFALGRAQELCILLDEYWERTNLDIPIYISAGLTMQANVYYKLLISWTNQKVKHSYVTRNTFDFKHVTQFERSKIDAPGPCVAFATPGMLSGGLSLEVFKHWAPSEANMIVLPGFCIAGTVGSKLMAGRATKIDLDKRTQLDVRCQIQQLSFSAHTDAKGIMDLVRHVAPKNVVLVHGEKPKMIVLKNKISTDLGIPCYDPANLETVEIASRCAVKVRASEQFHEANLKISEQQRTPDVPVEENHKQLEIIESLDLSQLQTEVHHFQLPHARGGIPVNGFVVMDNTSRIRVIQPDEVSSELGVTEHHMSFSCVCPIYPLLDAEEDKPFNPRGPSPIHLNASEDSLQGAPVDMEHVQEEEPSKKRYRMDLQRHLSLDLEREPVFEDSAEEGYRFKSSAANRDIFGPPKRVPGGGISLDINATPDLSSPAESPSNGSTSHLGILSLWPAHIQEQLNSLSLLRVIYLCLVKFLGEHVLEEKHDCIECRSFRISVCPDSPFPNDLSTRVDHRRKPAVMLLCEWSSEAQVLADRCLDVLRRLKLKL
ncbi:hypothetical protein KC19_VG095700 [Ceratodon purpureus]|uniref:Cleavage and polyadenylation specificity factor subunit 3-II n=1 Tax=Ceratodon purpureus TaxID=3225 RepID=A0A8T0HNV6_CERPU|nr:hypothetical protein KC19_VG095700 [Ceratodon purpureus]